MIGVYDYTVIATYLAMVLGLCGIFQSMGGHSLTAIICLLLSGLLDAFDGRIARTKKNRTEAEKRFGIQIDSLNDIICFGVLPAAIGYSIFTTWYSHVPTWAIATFSFYTLAGLIRLAYFNTSEEERGSELGTNRTYYLGLPITASSIVFPLFYLLSLLLPSFAKVLIIVCFLILGALFITPLHVRKPHSKGLILLILIAVVVLAGLFTYAFKLS